MEERVKTIDHNNDVEIVEYNTKLEEKVRIVLSRKNQKRSKSKIN